MSGNLPPQAPPAPQSRPRTWLLIVLGAGLLLSWLIAAPPGLLGKSDALGYAVCHRIASHSFFLAERPFSLCARCTGQYLGFLGGFAFQLLRGKKRFGFPPRSAWILLGLLLASFLADGINSVLHFYSPWRDLSLYEPLNSLRLLTGLGMGLALSAILYPLAGQATWRDYSLEPALSGAWSWAAVVGGALAVWGLILSGNPLVLYPLVLLSTAGLIVLLTVIYAVIWMLVFKKENSLDSWRDVPRWALAGAVSALAQVMAVDAVRYFLTGTWSGFLDP